MDGKHVAHEDGAASAHPLACVRRRHGWSYQDVARVIAEHARALGVPMAARREKVWRWEHWGVVPEADSQRALARALGIPARELETRPWPRWLPAHGGMPDGLPWTVEGSRSALASLADEAGGDPRGFPVCDGPALLDAIADWDAAEAEGTAEAASQAAAKEAGRAAPGAHAGRMARLEAEAEAAARGAAGRATPGAGEDVPVSVRAKAPVRASSPAVRRHGRVPVQAPRTTAEQAGTPGIARPGAERSAAVPRSAAAGGQDAGGGHGGIGAGSGYDAVDGLRAGGDAVTPPRAVQPLDGSVVEWLEAGVLGLRRLDDRLGGSAVRHRVEADLQLVSGLLARGAHTGAVQRRLLRVAADLAQLGGWAATDTGRHGVAQRHFLTGLRLAHSCGDRALSVGLWGGLSLQAVVAGRPQDAVAAAEAAVRAAGGAPPAVRALAAVRLGRAHAAAGAEGPFRRAAAEAERQLDRSAGDPGPAWLYWLDEAELVAQSGQALLDLGQAHAAGPLLEQALAVQDAAYVRDRALYSARAGLARAMTGDRDGARVLARDAADLARLCGTPRIAAALAALDLHLT